MATRICPRCNRELPTTAFGQRPDRPQGSLRSYCSDCERSYKAEHYQENAALYKKRSHDNAPRYKQSKRLLMIEYLQNHPCVDCGEKDIVVLHMDHVAGNKRANIATMINNKTSWPTILKEISKCEVRCANCHQRRTALKAGYYKTR